jgi:ribonuclease HII
MNYCDDSNENKLLSFLKNNLQKKLEKNEHRVIKRNTTKHLKNQPLRKFFNDEDQEGHIITEAGVDEAGRGPMFGPVVTAAVILPRDDSFDHSMMKDSKRFTSKKKIREAYEYIKDNALDYCIHMEDNNVIDEINIRQATLASMRASIDGLKNEPDFLIIDGKDFTGYKDIDYVCVEGGDDLYTPIAAASILAKVFRDDYIDKLCDTYPDFDEKYGIRKNKGYGTKNHMEGIKEHGITQFHRKSFGICKNYA